MSKKFNKIKGLGDITLGAIAATGFAVGYLMVVFAGIVFIK